MDRFAVRKHRRRFLVVTGLWLILGVVGCSTSDQPGTEEQQDKLRVVSTSTILTDLTARIAGQEVELTGILHPGADPHIYEPVPADTKALEQADLILYNGYNLEPNLIRLMNSVGANATKVAVGEVVKPLELQKNRETVPDPHVWGDVQNSIEMVKAIRDQLIVLSPTDRTTFTQNADQLLADLQKLDQWVHQQVKTIPPNQRKLITTHDAFQYYARAYGLEVMGTLIGISTEEQPSAQTIQQLVRVVKSAKVPVIFAETTINPALIRTVAEEAGVQLAPRSLYSDSIGAVESDGHSYIDMMASNTCAIANALGGRCTPLASTFKAEPPDPIPTP